MAWQPYVTVDGSDPPIPQNQNIGVNLSLPSYAEWAVWFNDSGRWFSFYVTPGDNGILDPATGQPLTGKCKLRIQMQPGQKYEVANYVMTWTGGGKVGNRSGQYVLPAGSSELNETTEGTISNVSFVKQNGVNTGLTTTTKNRLTPYRTLRFMTSERVNEDESSGTTEFDPNYPYVGFRQVLTGEMNLFANPRSTPEEVALMCIETNSDLWMCFHHRSTPASIANFVTRLMSAGYTGKMYVELSNEIWNTFPQGNYYDALAISEGGYTGPGPTANRQAVYSDKAEEVCSLVKTLYGSNAYGVLAGRTSTPNFANNWKQVADGGYAKNAHPSIDYYSCSFYYGGPPARALTDTNIDAVGLATLLRDDWETRVKPFILDWKTNANDQGRELILYEGGSHADNANETINDHLAALSRSAECAVVLGEAFDWLHDNLDGNVACLFQDNGPPTGKGSTWSTLVGEQQTTSELYSQVIART